ncbi:MAG TPA: SDR family oxidoreductase [Balneolaceae bacterium]|nr:SDR family oxidoreductase [Balneolaceae bacterium]
MILITGANGELGTATIEQLISKNPNMSIAGLVRSEKKGEEIAELGAEMRIGDYHDKPSIDNALKGVEILLLISSSSLEDRIEQHKNVINAAKQAGVKHIIYTSMLQADKELSPLTADHHATEKFIKNSGLNYSINRQTFYTEFFPMFLGQALETGTWAFPSNGEKVNFAYRTDMAEALANIITGPDKHTNQVYELTSSISRTLDEYATILSEASGKEIIYKDISVQEYVDGLESAGQPDDIITVSKLSAITVADGALNLTTGDLEKLLGREPKSTLTFIRDFAGE